MTRGRLLPDDALAPEELGVEPVPYEQVALSERLPALAGESSDFGGSMPATVPCSSSVGSGLRRRGAGVGIDPSAASTPDQDDLARLGITSRFPLFPESMGRPVPAVGAAG